MDLSIIAILRRSILLPRRLFQLAVAGALVAAASLSLSSRPAAPDVPACFVQPPVTWPAVAAAPGAGVIACKLLAKVLQTSDDTQLAWIPGAVLNKMLRPKVDAFPNSAYAIRFAVTTQFNATFTGPDSLVRFASNDFDARIGSWWTVLEAISDPLGRLDDKATIAEELALPETSSPSVEAVASEVRVGTVGYFGLVAPAFAHPGGSVQFWFSSEPVRPSANTLQ